MAAGPVAQGPRPEVVKAEFVVRFPEFVDWPSSTSDRPLSLCLSRSHPFGTNVQNSASGHPRTRQIIVRQLQEQESPRACDALFVAPADVSLLEAVAELPILTIGDQPNFCQRGGIINLLVIDGRVRFEIDFSRAKRLGLKLDSQLLRLASKVYGGQE
jgi:hypothetical protein